MNPQDNPAFLIPTWQSVLDIIKESAKTRIEELRNQHSGDDDALAKILVCDNRINNTKCWNQYNGEENLL